MSEKKKYERPIITKHVSGLMNKFGSGPSTKVISEIEGIQVKELIEKFGSPLFVISEKKIRQNQRNAYRIFKTRYPKVQYAWSYKTNYLDAVCSVFHSENSWAEVVSEFEYDKARSLGVEGEKIIFNGPDKSRAALHKAITNKSKIHIDNFDELYEIIDLCNEKKLKAKVAIRVNMDVNIYPLWDRFGFNFENGEALQAVKRILHEDNLELIGLHTHIGTYIMTPDAYRIAASRLASLANIINSEYGIPLEYIDLGGGFASNNTLIGQYLPADQVVPSIEQFADAIVSGLYEVNYDRDKLPTLILETGRALIDDAGFLLSTVIANKRLSSGKRALIIDAGVNILFTSFWYKHKISPAQDNGMHTEDTSVFGPLCMNIDCIRDSILLPPLQKDDNVVIEYAGAYNVTQWMQFISLRPSVVMIMENSTVEIIRQKEELPDIQNKELLPVKFKSKIMSV